MKLTLCTEILSHRTYWLQQIMMLKFVIWGCPELSHRVLTMLKVWTRWPLGIKRTECFIRKPNKSRHKEILCLITYRTMLPGGLPIQGSFPHMSLPGGIELQKSASLKSSTTKRRICGASVVSFMSFTATLQRKKPTSFTSASSSFKDICFQATHAFQLHLILMQTRNSQTNRGQLVIRTRWGWFFKD